MEIIAKATIVMAVAIVAGWLARRRRAAVRHLIFSAAFAGLALLPAATAVMPAVFVPLPATAAIAEAPRATTVNPPVEAVAFLEEAPSASNAASGREPVRSTFALLPIIWLAGVSCCLVPVATGLWQIRRVRRDGLPWADAQAMTNELAGHAGFRRAIDVVVHEALTGPITCGVLRPAIVFPPDARTWSHADVRRALTHELEHVRRCDWVTLCLARAICALYWFHPLVWIANRQLSLNAERACDDAVLGERDAFGYAEQLVALAERSARTRRPLLAMANRGDLSTRVQAVLNTRQQRGPAGMWARAAITTAAALSVALLAPLRTVAGAVGQPPPAARLQFDVASIKPYFDPDRIMSVRPLPGRLTADATLQVLMQHAYGVQTFQIVGGPEWLASDRYQIDAKAGGTANRDQLSLMLRSLLEDRFRLRTHRETKELPVFALVSNRGGFKLPAPKEGVCVESAVDAAAEWVGSGRMAFPGELPPAKSRCGAAVAGLGQLRGGRIAMSELVRVLSMLSARSVIDRTGFSDLFDVQLDFVPDETTPSMPLPPPGSAVPGVSLAQALQEQLGLRLEPARGPVEVLVIDSVEKPTEN